MYVKHIDHAYEKQEFTFHSCKNKICQKMFGSVHADYIMMAGDNNLD